MLDTSALSKFKPSLEKATTLSVSPSIVLTLQKGLIQVWTYERTLKMMNIMLFYKLSILVTLEL